MKQFLRMSTLAGVIVPALLLEAGCKKLPPGALTLAGGMGSNGPWVSVSVETRSRTNAAVIVPVAAIKK